MSGTPYAFLKGELMPLADAKIGLMTHAFNYGTAVFEGIRANWNAEHETLYLFRAREHFARLRKSAHVLMMDLRYSDDELIDLTRRLVTNSGFHEDLYIRPMVYKSQEVLGVRLHDIEDDLLIYCAPFGAYLDLEAGIRCCTSSWRRADDTSIPVRAKVTGVYINSALAKTEATTTATTRRSCSTPTATSPRAAARTSSWCRTAPSSRRPRPTTSWSASRGPR